MILIVTNKNDDHADIVIRRLNSIGESFFRINTEQPFNYSMSIRKQKSHVKNLKTGKSIVLSEVTSVWLRRRSPLDAPHLDEHFFPFVESEWSHYLRNLWAQLDDVLWMNHPTAIEYGRNKMVQLGLAEQVGFCVPDTLYSNFPDDIIAFQKKHGVCIYKAHDGWSFAKKNSSAVYTSIIDKPITKKSSKELVICPGIFQPYIKKAFELRITVVGSDIFATKIDSQACLASRADWRKPNFKDIPHQPYVLENADRAKCLILAKRLNLTFAAIDAIVTPQNKFIFLEINCNGQWAWIEAMTHQAISMSIAKTLALGSKGVRPNY